MPCGGWKEVYNMARREPIAEMKLIEALYGRSWHKNVLFWSKSAMWNVLDRPLHLNLQPLELWSC